MPRYKVTPKSESVSVQGLEFRADSEGCFELPDNPVILDQLRDHGFQLAITDAMDGQESTVAQAQKIATLEADLDAAAKQKALVDGQLADREHEVEGLRKKVHELEEAAGPVEQQVANLNLQLTERTHQLEAERKRADEQSERANKAEEERDQAKKHDEETTVTLVQAEEDKKRLQDQYDELATRPSPKSSKKSAAE